MKVYDGGFMSSFTDKLVVSQYSDDRWLIEREFSYYIGNSSGPYINIPVGFKTDFTSTPRIFWIFFPPAEGLHIQAAVLHDYLYEGGVIWDHGFATTCSYREADHVFLEAMQVLKVPKWKRFILFCSVRLYSSCIKPFIN